MVFFWQSLKFQVVSFYSVILVTLCIWQSLISQVSKLVQCYPGNTVYWEKSLIPSQWASVVSFWQDGVFDKVPNTRAVSFCCVILMWVCVWIQLLRFGCQLCRDRVCCKRECFVRSGSVCLGLSPVHWYLKKWVSHGFRCWCYSVAHQEQ